MGSTSTHTMFNIQSRFLRTFYSRKELSKTNDSFLWIRMNKIFYFNFYNGWCEAKKSRVKCYSEVAYISFLNQICISFNLKSFLWMDWSQFISLLIPLLYLCLQQRLRRNKISSEALYSIQNWKNKIKALYLVLKCWSTILLLSWPLMALLINWMRCTFCFYTEKIR